MDGFVWLQLTDSNEADLCGGERQCGTMAAPVAAGPVDSARVGQCLSPKGRRCVWVAAGDKLQLF